jgi:Clp amino terminal domain, pathogenicity island component
MNQQPVGLDSLISHVVGRHPDGDPLQHLADAVETSAYLGEVADHLIGHFVDQARSAGASWTEIGTHMGVTKQAVQKRFVPKESDDLDFPTTRRLSRFTPRAHNVLTFAKAQARDRGDRQVDNEHLVLGLLSEPDGLAARAIVEVGVPLEQARGAVLAALGSSRRKAGHTSFSSGAKKTIELSLREALRLEHNYIGTEHLLLGLLRNDRERAARILIDLGVTMDRAERWILAEVASLKTT